ncbi:MAG: LruC domain-containing protein [Mediterranea sp.]|nr:LruC domain-containing protein [Mediterranea sp.]
MKRNTILLFIMAAVVLLTGCLGGNVYDPTKKPEIPPTENPLGEGFTAPPSFDWTMYKSISLTAEVKDEFNGQYNYLIEVFAQNPLLTSTATPIATGVAGKGQNYTATLILPIPATELYIRKTDPKQRKETYAFTVPAASGSITCKLYPGGAATRAVGSSTAAVDAAKAEGFSEPEVDPKTWFTLPSNWTELPKQDGRNEYPGGSNFLIEGTFNREINASTNSGRVKVYVKGTWAIPTNEIQSNLDIYVLNGGKIEVTKDGFQFGKACSISVQEGGTIDIKVANNVTFQDAPFYNFGTLKSGTNATITFGDNMVLNYGDILVKKKMKFVSATVSNHGTISVDEWLDTNTPKDKYWVNWNSATIKAYKWTGGGTIYNDGFIEVTLRESATDEFIYNACTIIAKESFDFIKMTLDKGSLTSGQDSNGKWLPVPLVTSPYSTEVTMKNGSLIKATNLFFTNGGSTVTGVSGGDISMLKAGTIELGEYNWDTRISGNLVLERDTVISPNDSQWSSCFHAEGIPTTGYDESQYTVETCGGILNEGNEGETPTNPTYPLVTDDDTGYTFAFEDNWPVYGDLDFNDAVVSIDNIITEQRADGSLQAATIKGSVRAVGASKTLTLALRMQTIPNSYQLISSDLHRFMGNATGDNEFINTKKGGYTKTPATFEVKYTFSGTSVMPVDFNINMVDLYISTPSWSNKTMSIEIHLPDIAPTDKADPKLFDTGDDASTLEGYYLSKERIAWAIMIPAPFAWPLEYKNIKDVYPDFKSWITSGGTNNPDWYQNHNGDVFE